MTKMVEKDSSMGNVQNKQHPKVPKLRFPGFEGEWEERKLGEICKMQAGKFVSSSEITNKFQDTLYPCYGGNGLRGYTKSYNQTGLYSLIGRQGALCGNVTLVNGKFHATEHAVIVNPAEDIDNLWLHNLLTHLNLNQYATGAAQPGLSVQNLEKIEIRIPNSKIEQQRISLTLDLITQRIHTQSKIIRELMTFKTIASQKIFSQKFKFKDDNGSFFPAWEIKKLKDISDINPKSNGIPNAFYYIDLESVEGGRLLKETRISRFEAPSRAQRVLKRNDVLFQMVRPYQKNNFFFEKEGEYVASTGYAQIRAKQNAQFIYQYLHDQKFVDKVIERCTGTSYPAISANDLGNIIMNFPSHAEQIKIANFLSSIDKKVELEKKILNNNYLQKQHLLKLLFI